MNKAAYPHRKTFSKLIIFVQPCYEIWLYIFMYVESGGGGGINGFYLEDIPAGSVWYWSMVRPRVKEGSDRGRSP